MSLHSRDRRRLRAFVSALQGEHNFVSALSAAYTDTPPPSSPVTQYDSSVDQLCRDLMSLLKP
jgi:hypothetical protein